MSKQERIVTRTITVGGKTWQGTGRTEAEAFANLRPVDARGTKEE
jgi:hypothetical protein